MKLSLSKAEGTTSYDEESNIFESITLRVVLLNHQTIELKTTTGDTISIIKKKFAATSLC